MGMPSVMWGQAYARRRRNRDIRRDQERAGRAQLGAHAGLAAPSG